jgi:hypothetical protein
MYDHNVHYGLGQPIHSSPGMQEACTNSFLKHWNNQLNFISIMVTDIFVQSKLPIDIDCFYIDRTKGCVW